MELNNLNCSKDEKSLERDAITMLTLKVVSQSMRSISIGIVIASLVFSLGIAAAAYGNFLMVQETNHKYAELVQAIIDSGIEITRTEISVLQESEKGGANSISNIMNKITDNNGGK